MKFYFEQPYSLLLLLTVIAVALGLSFLLYRHQQKEAYYTLIQIRILAVLRFFSLLTLGFMLLSPAVELYRQYKIKPILVFAIDNSESQKEYRKNCEELINKAKQNFPDFETEFWTFGEKAKKSTQVDGSELRSDYGEIFKTLKDEYLGKKIGAVVIAGDGIFNSGTNPVFNAETLPYPVYTIGIGDSTTRADAAILKVTSNATAYLDNYFPLEINLLFKKFAGKNSTLTVWDDGKQVYQTVVYINSSDFFKQELVHLQATQAGLHHYRVSIDEFTEETNKVNNQYEFSVRVIEQKQRILIAAHGADPDIAALVKVIEPQKNFEYELLTDPQKQIDVEHYDLFILDQLPDASAANSPLIQQILKSKRPVLWMVGAQTSLSVLNNLNVGFSIGNNQGFEFAYPAFNKNFSLFKANEQLSHESANWSPLQVPFADVQLKGDWQVLYYQQLQQIQTQRPLVFLGRPDKVKYGVILGEGIWQWRVQDFLQNGSFEQFDELLLKLINFLVLKPGDDNFNVFYQSDYHQDQNVTMTAELLNESLEPVTGPEVTINIKAGDGETYNYKFESKLTNYSLNAGHLPAGDFDFEASVTLGEIKYTDNGSFSISKVQLEQQNMQANFNLLFQLANRTGGKYVSPERFNELASAIESKATSAHEKISQLIYEKFISLKIVFLLIVLLLSLEWFLRKFWGSY